MDNLIAYCGLYCALCPAYICKEKECGGSSYGTINSLLKQVPKAKKMLDNIATNK